MPIPSDRQTLGKWGEDLACAELERRGYAVLARRFRSRFGEIDIICRDGERIVFVEVKARRSRRYGTAAESLTPFKRRRIAAMALEYLACTHQLNARCRFDVVAIDAIGTKRMTMRVFADAFSTDGR